MPERAERFDRDAVREAAEPLGVERRVLDAADVAAAWALGAGFAVRAVREPRPTAEALRARPDLEDAARVPYNPMLDLVR